MKAGERWLDAGYRCRVARAFLAEMRQRGVERLDDPALEYHLALLLKPDGHPTITVPSPSDDGEKP
jgi:hypothetical protein